MTDAEMDALVHSTGGMTDAEMEAPTGVKAMAKGLGYKGPRNYSDEELGIDEGPITQRVIAKQGPAAVVGTPVTQQERTGLAAPKPKYTPERLNEMAHQSGELENDPTAQMVVGGVLSGGAANLVGGGARLALASRLSKPVAASVGRVVGGTAGGATGTAIQGGNAKDIAIGAALGGGLVAAPEVLTATQRGIQSGAGALRRMMRDPRGEMGRTIGNLEQGEAAGIPQSQEFQNLKRGLPGIEEAAAQKDAAILGRNEAFKQAERQNYDAEQQRILGAEPDRYHYIPDSHAALNQLEANNTVNGVVGDEGLAKAIQKTRDMLTAKTGAVDRTATAAAQEVRSGAPAEYIDAPAVKVEDLVKTKRIVDSLAGYGAPATPENVPYRQLSKILGQELEGVSPEMAALNQRYHGAMSQVERTNELVGLGSDKDAVLTPARARSGAGILSRAGQETQTASRYEPALNELAAMSPENAADINFVRYKNAYEGTRFGAPHVPHSMSRVPIAFALQNARALGVRGVYPLLERLELTEPVLGRVSPEAIAAGLGAAPRNRKENRR